MRRTRTQWALLMVLFLTVACGAVEATEADRPAPKSHANAITRSLVPTIGMPVIGMVLLSYDGENDDVLGWAGFWIMTTGLILGPSQGHIYAERRHPFSGAAIRFGCALGAGIGLVAGVADAFDGGDNSAAPEVLFIAGTLGLVASATYDIATVSRSVDDYNRRVSAISMSIGPTVDPDSKSIGLGFAVRW